MRQHGPDVLVSSGAPFDPRGGMAASYANIARLLRERGYEVAERYGPVASGRLGWFKRQSEYARVAGALQRERPRVAIVSSADSSLAALLPHRTRIVAMSNGIEHLARLSADTHGYGQHHFTWGHRHVREPLLRVAFQRADACVVLSRGQRDFVTATWGIDPGRVHVLPQSVEDAFHERRDLPRDPDRVLWIGQWAEFKGLDRLHEIVATVVAERPSTRFVLAGVKTDPDQVTASFPAHLRGNLEVHALVERSAMVDLVATAHAGLVTSYFEGFGKMILEKLAGGLPTVASRVAASEDYIEHGVSGYLYETADDAARLLLDVLAAPYDRAMGEAARAAVRTCRRATVGDAWGAIVEEQLSAGSRGRV